MELGLNSKRALVLGASAGIGYAVAKGLLREGARVAVCSRDAGRIESARKNLGAELALSCDLSTPGAGKKVVQDVIAKWGGIDILVVNTGGPPKGSFEDTSSDLWLAGFQGLWMSAVDSIRESLPEMKTQKWGRILLVTSVAAKEPMAGLTVSNGLRAGLLGLTKSISNEIASHGITINALLPGFTDTERLRDLKLPPEKVTAQVPAGRIGLPEEFADLAVFLASERAAYITGQAIACDGGYLRGI